MNRGTGTNTRAPLCIVGAACMQRWCVLARLRFGTAMAIATRAERYVRCGSCGKEFLNRVRAILDRRSSSEKQGFPQRYAGAGGGES